MIPTESEEQIALFEWTEWESGRIPQLRLMFHIPNGGKRNKATAARLKREGVKAGVPDVFLPVPRGRYHGLFIEMKREKGGRLSQEQKRWLEELSKMGYKAEVCRGWEEAAKTVTGYLRQAEREGKIWL